MSFLHINCGCYRNGYKRLNKSLVIVHPRREGGGKRGYTVTLCHWYLALNFVVQSHLICMPYFSYNSVFNPKKICLKSSHQVFVHLLTFHTPENTCSSHQTSTHMTCSLISQNQIATQSIPCIGGFVRLRFSLNECYSHTGRGFFVASLKGWSYLAAPLKILLFEHSFITALH